LQQITLYSSKAEKLPAAAAETVAVKADGSFTIADVAPGSYVLVARAPGLSPSQLLAGTLAVEVKDQHLEGIKVAMKSGRDVKATVSFAEKSTVRANGLAVYLQAVTPMGAGLTGQMLGDETALTFRGVLPVPYRAQTVYLPPNCSCFVKSILYGGREIPDSGVDITTGKPFEIVLSTGAAVVEGTVTDRQGKPVGGATLALAPAGATPGKLRTGTTDAAGKYYFDGNPPGDYTLLAWEDIDLSALEEPGFLRQFDANAKSVKLDPLGHQNVVLVAIPAK
jgi:hypothetical protein